MFFKRILELRSLKRSAFLFGPRMTGKTSLLRALSYDLLVDLLDPELELKLKRSPRLFWEQILALKAGGWSLSMKSSARKLKRGGANLLGGAGDGFKNSSLDASGIGRCL